MTSVSLALLIFGVCYLVIITERTHKTIVALFGAAVMIGSRRGVARRSVLFP